MSRTVKDACSLNKARSGPALRRIPPGIKALPGIVVLLLLLVPGQAFAGASINGDPYVDELLTNGCVSQSQYWSEIKERLTEGHVDEAVNMCRKALARHQLDVDMHCLYAIALEMKLRSGPFDSAVFDEAVREWAHVAKYRVLADSKGWEHVGDGEVFSQNQERRAMANRHLVNLVGRAPKYFESEKAFVERAIRVNTKVAGKLKNAI